MKIGRDERGFISIMILVLFVVISLFLFSLYRYTITDYIVSSVSLDEKTEQLKQFNLLESLKGNYIEDMLNDVPYEKMKDKMMKDENWKLEYLNYQYEYVKKDDEKLGNFGKFEWIDFKNYDMLIPEDENMEDTTRESRLYKVSQNWDSGDKSGVYEDGKLTLPKHVYIKVNFDDNVSRILLKWGNSFEMKEIDLIKRKPGDNIYYIDDVPPSVEEVIVESDVPLGGTLISVLKARELGIKVYKNDRLGNKEGDAVLVKTLRVELSKGENKIKYKELGDE